MRRELHDQLGGGTLPDRPEAQMAAHAPEAASADLRGGAIRTRRPRGGEAKQKAGRQVIVPLSLRARTR